MTDPEEFDFDWNARHNAKPIEERTIVKAAVAAVMEIGPTPEGKAELDRVLDEIERNSSKEREDCEKQAAMVEMFPRLIEALESARESIELIVKINRIPANNKGLRDINSVLPSARALLP